MVLTNEELDTFLAEAGITSSPEDKEKGGVDKLLIDAFSKAEAPPKRFRMAALLGSILVGCFLFGLLLPSPLSIAREKAALEQLALEFQGHLDEWKAQRTQEEAAEERLLEDLNPPFLEQEIIESLEPSEFSFA